MLSRSLFLCLALLALPAAVHAAETFQAGRDYYEVSFAQQVETGPNVEVREFFWYGCPHCYDLEPAVDAWLKRKPANVTLVRTPGTYEPWLLHARAYYALEALGAVDKAHAAIFQAMHAEKRPLRDAASVADVVAARGVDRQRFLDAMKSFGVNMKIERARQIQQDLGLTAVPAFLVDGRYMTTPSMLNLPHGQVEERTLKVVEFLAAKAARERGARPKR